MLRETGRKIRVVEYICSEGKSRYSLGEDGDQEGEGLWCNEGFEGEGNE